MNKRLQLLLILSLTLCFVLALNAAHTNASTWKIEYHESGGIDGRVLSIALTSDGKADTKGGLGPGAWQTEFQVPAQQLSEVQALVDGLKLSGSPKPRLPRGRPIPDMVYVTLDITYGGQIYPIQSPPARLTTLLHSLISQGKKQAEDEKWTKAGEFKLGRVWHVTEEVRDSQGLWHGEKWEGTWTRKGDTRTFDAVWRNNKSHEELRDAVEVDVAERGLLKLHRTGSKISYNGYYPADKPNDLLGYVSSCPTCSWRAQIEY